MFPLSSEGGIWVPDSKTFAGPFRFTRILESLAPGILSILLLDNFP